ncbi:hypothetical protein [Demequina oxidasica]|uniref:hypothetical protein n=1 Tax=Demequina oxidasica TaxID=676199 RepID=UPI0007805C07|nr:hypothetical protein [Demequina oxidasica]
MSTTITTTPVKSKKVERGMADVKKVARLLGIKTDVTEFPGLGKAVKTDTGAIYVNGGYADVRGSKEQVAAWVKAGNGVERSATYVRVAL